MRDRAASTAPVDGADLDPEVRTILRWTSYGSLLPVLGWVYGIGTLWTSHRFSRRDKLVGFLLFPGGWFGAAVAVWLIARQSDGYCYTSSVRTGDSMRTISESGCVEPALHPAISIPLTLAVLVAAALGPVYLRARARH